MSEIIIQQELEHDINDALDKVLAFESYQSSDLDILLTDEAILAARSRMSHLWDIFEAEKIESKIEQFFEAEKIYSEYYPSEDPHEDNWLVGERRNLAQLLKKYGSKEAQESPEIQLASKYPTEWRVVMDDIESLWLSQAAGSKLMVAMGQFADQLYEVGFIETDDMLEEPMALLGEHIIALIGGCGDNASQEWREYLKNEVINKEDLVGDNPKVMHDTTEYLYQLVLGRVILYRETGCFSKKEDIANQEYFSPEAWGGADAIYFSAIRARRLDEEASSAEVVL